jgi:crotonobetainyl-CoA:carnitine CoA-transferase CaiB-like acyl-CoA transferase
VVEVLQERDVPSGELVEVNDVLTRQQEMACTTVETVAVGGRSWKVTDFPIRLSATPGEVTTPGPPVGQENEIVRQDADKAWESIFEHERTVARVQT